MLSNGIGPEVDVLEASINTIPAREYLFYEGSLPSIRILEMTNSHETKPAQSRE